MKILFLAQRVPEPPNKGDKIRSHHLMRRLAQRHTVQVACLADGAAEESHLAAARGWAASVTSRVRRPAESAVRGALSAFSGRPMSVGFFRSTGLADDVRELVRAERFDVALAYCSSMAEYLRGFDGPKVLDLVDVDSEKWAQYAARSSQPQRTIYAWEHRLLQAYERKVVDEFDRTVVISESEKATLARFASTENVYVVANGVDLESLARPRPRPTAPVLVFVGALDYFANEEGIEYFAREALPVVRRRVPDARLRIVGRRPGERVHALGEISGVDVVGEVDDVRPELWDASVAVVPLRIAQGLQNKVLEAMAASLPVVSSRAAVRGVDGRAGEHYLLGDSPEEFADAVERLVTDRSAADAQAARALELVRRRYSWESKALEYEAVLEAAVESGLALAGCPS